MSDPRETADTPFGPVDVTALRDAVALVRALHESDTETADEILKPYLEDSIRLMVRGVMEAGLTPTEELTTAFASELGNLRSLVQALTSLSVILGRNLADWVERPFDELLEHYARTLAAGDQGVGGDE